MAQRTVRIGSSVGLHARPAKLFTQAVKASGHAVTIAKGDGAAVGHMDDPRHVLGAQPPAPALTCIDATNRAIPRLERVSRHDVTLITADKRRDDTDLRPTPALTCTNTREGISHSPPTGVTNASAVMDMKPSRNSCGLAIPVRALT